MEIQKRNSFAIHKVKRTGYFGRMLNIKNIEKNIRKWNICKDKERMWDRWNVWEKKREKRKEKKAVSNWTGRIARKEMCEKRNLLYVGISKFRCETKKGIGGYQRWDEMHQACGSGFVRPPLCLSFSALRRACSSYFYRLWQFPRRTLWVRKREKVRLSLRVSRRICISMNSMCNV